MRKYVVRFMIFYILGIGCLLGIIIYSYQNKIDRHNEQVEIEYPGVWKLSDEYDNRNSSYMEFLHQKNSLSILKKVYKELKKQSYTENIPDRFYLIMNIFVGMKNLHLDHIMTKRKMDILQI